MAAKDDDAPETMTSCRVKLYRPVSMLTAVAAVRPLGVRTLETRP
jgi:hypothetical protein